MGRLHLGVGVRYEREGQACVVVQVLRDERLLVEDQSGGGQAVVTRGELTDAWAGGALRFVARGPGARSVGAGEGVLPTAYTIADFHLLPEAARAEAWRRYTLIRPLLAWPAGARTRRAIEEYLSSDARGSHGQRVGPGGYQPGQRGAVPARVRGERGGHPGAGAGHGAGRRRGGCGCRRGRSSRCMTRSWRRGVYCATGRRAGRGRRSPSSWTSETRIARGGPRFIPAASKSKGVSYKWLVELDAQLRAEIMVLLALAERMDEREQHHRDGAAR